MIIRWMEYRLHYRSQYGKGIENRVYVREGNLYNIVNKTTNQNRYCKLNVDDIFCKYTMSIIGYKIKLCEECNICHTRFTYDGNVYNIQVDV